MASDYTCAVCHGVFPCAEGEALDASIDEALTTWGSSLFEGPVVAVCDDCHQRMLREYPPEQALRDRYG